MLRMALHMNKTQEQYHPIIYRFTIDYLGGCEGMHSILADPRILRMTLLLSKAQEQYPRILRMTSENKIDFVDFTFSDGSDRTPSGTHDDRRFDIDFIDIKSGGIHEGDTR